LTTKATTDYTVPGTTKMIDVFIARINA